MPTSTARIIAFLSGLLLALVAGVVPLFEGRTPTKEEVLTALGVALMAYVTRFHRDVSPEKLEKAVEVARMDAAKQGYEEGVRASQRPSAPWAEGNDDVTPRGRK